MNVFCDDSVSALSFKSVIIEKGGVKNCPKITSFMYDLCLEIDIKFILFYQQKSPFYSIDPKLMHYRASG